MLALNVRIVHYGSVDNRLSPRELADALGVSESSVKRWVDGGELAAVRTAGGHRRIARSEALRFAKAKNVVPARPEMFSVVGLRFEDSELDDVERGSALHRSLLDDDRPRALGLLTSAFLSGTSIALLCDGPIRFALERIGAMWKHDDSAILYEHRATDLCLHALEVMRAALPTPAADAPVAVGSAGPEDPYMLPSMMCAAALAELGFRDVNLGPRTPVATKVAAVERYRPLLVWHSASVGGEEIPMLAAAIRRSSGAPDVRIVVGGRATTGLSLPAAMVPLASMRELQVFARGLLPVRATASP